MCDDGVIDKSWMTQVGKGQRRWITHRSTGKLCSMVYVNVVRLIVLFKVRLVSVFLALT